MVKNFEEFPGIDWIEGTGEFIMIQEEICTGCANCLKVCLADCFEIINTKAIIKSLDKCMECGACWYVCTEGALIFKWPRGGTGYKSNWG
ncbi:MAG: DUF362 domain-containing protein [Candidatus Hodarchaeota archaeon]